MLRGLPLLLTLAACSYTFDEAGGGLPLLGAPPTGLVALNQAPVENTRLVRGVDDSIWAAMREQGGVLRLRRLSGEAAEEVWPFEQVQVFSRVIYLVRRSEEGGTEILLLVPGSTLIKFYRFPWAPADGWLLVGGDGAVFFYWAKDEATRTFELVRRDGVRRVLPKPAGIDPRSPQASGLFFFDAAGDWLFVRDGLGEVWAHATAQERDVALGPRPRALYVDEAKGGPALLACGDGGLRRVGLDGAEVVLSPAPCAPSGLRFLGERAYLLINGRQHGVPLDGSAPPSPVPAPGAQQVLGFTPEGEVMYSLDPADLYVRGASDGWIGGWRFMARGRQAAFSRDGQRLRFLESAATLSGSGDLMSGPGRGGEALMLGHNVRSFAELPDGRLLLVANYAFRGSHNRLVVLDERAGAARWVADGASGYVLLPGSKELLALYSIRGGSDVVRVPIPPP